MPLDKNIFIGGLIGVILILYVLPIWLTSKLTKQKFFDVMKVMIFFLLIQFVVAFIITLILGYTIQDIKDSMSLVGIVS